MVARRVPQEVGHLVCSAVSSQKLTLRSVNWVLLSAPQEVRQPKLCKDPQAAVMGPAALEQSASHKLRLRCSWRSVPAFDNRGRTSARQSPLQFDNTNCEPPADL